MDNSQNELNKETFQWNNLDSTRITENNELCFSILIIIIYYVRVSVLSIYRQITKINLMREFSLQLI